MPYYEIDDKPIGWAEHVNVRGVSGTYDQAQQRITFDVAGGGGGGGGGNTQLLDLGVLNAVDLLAGPVTIYTPSGPTFVGLTVGETDFVQHDSAFDIFAPWPGLTGNNAFGWKSGDATPVDVQSYGAWPVAFITAFPLVAIFDFGGSFQQGSIVGWQANHAYDPATDDLISEAGHFWQASVAGVAGGAAPDFAGSIGGFTAPDGVIDNGFGGGWLDKGLVPTVGSIHLYALVAIP